MGRSPYEIAEGVLRTHCLWAVSLSHTLSLSLALFRSLSRSLSLSRSRSFARFLAIALSLALSLALFHALALALSLFHSLPLTLPLSLTHTHLGMLEAQLLLQVVAKQMRIHAGRIAFLLGKYLVSGFRV